MLRDNLRPTMVTADPYNSLTRPFLPLWIPTVITMDGVAVPSKGRYTFEAFVTQRHVYPILYPKKISKRDKNSR